MRYAVMPCGVLQAISEVKAGHASQASTKMAELANQLAMTRAGKDRLEEKLTAHIEEVSAKLAAEKRRSASLKVMFPDVPATMTHVSSPLHVLHLRAFSYNRNIWARI